MALANVDRFLYLSPHFDDVALSCGGTVARDTRSAQVTVVTVFAGDPPGELNQFAQFQHRRWGTSDDTVDARRAEDIEAMKALGAEPEWLDFPDAIYRGDLYLSDEDLFGAIKAADADTVGRVRDAVGQLLDKLLPAKVFAPLGVGGHVDHRLVREAALAARRPGTTVFLYEDFPYAAGDLAVERVLSSLDLAVEPQVVDVTDVMSSRIEAIAAYSSQLATIFRHYGEWDDVVKTYALRVSGRADRYAERLWRVR